MNGSLPAVDTIPVGGINDLASHELELPCTTTRGWRRSGIPRSLAATLTSDPSTFTAVFAAPGTYHYTDSYNQAPHGTVVVR